MIIEDVAKVGIIVHAPTGGIMISHVSAFDHKGLNLLSARPVDVAVALKNDCPAP
jgi:hypothetical protein